LRLNKERILFLLLLGGYLLPHILLLAEDRFHLAIVPVLAVLAGNAWHNRQELWARALAERRKTALALLLVAFLWLNWGMELWRDADKLALLFGPEGNVAGFAY
jgi:hypothetical protein